MTRTHATTAPAGALAEIFSGIQGEGIHVGRRQIFLRLAGCNLSCAYCDQPEARAVPETCRIEKTPGKRDFCGVPNPVPANAAIRAVLRLNTPAGLHHAVAVTGGEPLRQPEFLAALLPALRRKKLRILIETNGTLPEALHALLPWVDIVSMDIKLRSATGRPMPASRHWRFLRMAVRGRIAVYTKAVVTEKTTAAEVADAASRIRRIKRSVPLILQPVTSVGRRAPKPPAAEALLKLQEAAARFLDDVRVIPQTHRLMDQF